MPMVGGKKFSYDKKGIAAAKKAAKSDWDEETQEMIKRSQMMSDLGINEFGERTKRPAKVAPNKGGNFAKGKSTEARKRTAKKKTARQEALKMIRKGVIPASPTR
jgi:hypothetical protein